MTIEEQTAATPRARAYAFHLPAVPVVAASVGRQPRQSSTSCHVTTISNASSRNSWTAAQDVTAFAKLPQIFGFSIEYTDASMNLKSYEPDFVAIDDEGTHWLLEAKGQENIDVIRKDNAATRWCENATALTGTLWRYVKVPQKDYEALRPSRLADLAALQPVSLF